MGRPTVGRARRRGRCGGCRANQCPVVTLRNADWSWDEVLASWNNWNVLGEIPTVLGHFRVGPAFTVRGPRTLDRTLDWGLSLGARLLWSTKSGSRTVTTSGMVYYQVPRYPSLDLRRPTGRVWRGRAQRGPGERGSTCKEREEMMAHGSQES